MKSSFTLILSLFLLSTIVYAQKNHYIGYKHRGVITGETLPNAVKNLGGGLLSNDAYGVSRFSRGGKYMLWLEIIIDRNTKGVPDWEVKDVLIFNKPKKNQEFFLSYSSPCVQNGKSNLDLIVKAELLPNSGNYKILEAWKANIRKEKFEKISIRNIKCDKKTL